jgi:hypothetical protein
MDALFAHVQKMHADRPWGRVLDAGTGAHSLKWIASLPTASWTAVTADPALVARTGLLPRPQDRTIIGDWSDPALLAGEQFDTVVLDYFLGAVDGIAPYFGDTVVERLSGHIRGRVYAVGLEPWLDRSDDPAEDAFLELVRIRDATFLAARTRPYREWPRSRVERRLTGIGLSIVDARAFSIRHSARTLDREHGNVRRYAAQVADPDLGAALLRRADALRVRAEGLIGREFGRDWVVSASRDR